ncbi:hypothetical protein DFP72DRAFT_924003 [Ephemerocybe angulata]|uniref:Glycosyltransferase 61 catalytic domain-containing protein n=1 Tax=Ephemerocybe angulata TaxID=980116 RepID=A0A8H6HHW4_9AGAR|nr:hypothetical protein DFP72DRAFT_924003 [Tulosesus angulatus]
MVDVWSYGFSIFDKLYVKNGTFYAVTSRKESFPPKEGILTKIIIELEEGPYNPAEDRLQYLTPSEAKEVLGDYATVIPGMTMFIADPPQYLPHFYHFWGEVIIGAWRVYSALGFSKDNNGSLDRLSFPDRWIMPFIDREDEWRDKAGLNAPLMRLAFPSASIEKSEIWKDWIKSGNTLVFERSMVINRRAAHKSPLGFTWFKMISGTQNVSVPSNFWEPLRKSVTKNLFGYVPEVAASGKALVVPKFKHSKDTASSKPHSIKPIVTYISRQSTGRRLIDADHQGLVAALKELAMEGICEVRIPIMEHLTLQEQMAEITSSTIMIGVHGNGLTHQLFMPPSLRSAVFEIQPPGDYAFDYWMLSRNVGHKHYMVRNDTLTTFGPEEWHEGVNMGPLFHTTSIPVYGPVIADMVRKRLTQPERDVEP